MTMTASEEMEERVALYAADPLAVALCGCDDYQPKSKEETGCANCAHERNFHFDISGLAIPCDTEVETQ